MAPRDHHAAPEQDAESAHRTKHGIRNSAVCAEPRTSSPEESIMTVSNNFQSRADRIAADDFEVRAHIDRVVEGLRAKDLEALRRLYTTDVVSFDIEPPLQHVGIEAN